MPLILPLADGPAERRFAREMFELAASRSYPDLEQLGRITRRERLDDLFESSWEAPGRQVRAAHGLPGEPLSGLVWWQDSHHAVSGLPEWLALCLAVRPEARGRGLGRALMAHMLAEARGAGVSRVRLFVASDNSQAAGLYARLGFEPQTIEMRWTADREA